jgi:hypothetical protein
MKVSSVTAALCLLPFLPLIELKAIWRSALLWLVFLIRIGKVDELEVCKLDLLFVSLTPLLPFSTLGGCGIFYKD